VAKIGLCTIVSKVSIESMMNALLPDEIQVGSEEERLKKWQYLIYPALH
jgi:hypothetical protein